MYFVNMDLSSQLKNEESKFLQMYFRDDSQLEAYQRWQSVAKYSRQPTETLT